MNFKPLSELLFNFLGKFCNLSISQSDPEFTVNYILKSVLAYTQPSATKEQVIELCSKFNMTDVSKFEMLKFFEIYRM